MKFSASSINEVGLADRFQKNRPLHNSRSNLRPLQTAKERYTIQLTPENQENVYNRLFTLLKLRFILKNTKNSSLGPDKMHAEKIKKLSDENLLLILVLFNIIWHSGQIPTIWKESHIIVILKSAKPSHEASSYRPITLTLVL